MPDCFARSARFARIAPFSRLLRRPSLRKERLSSLLLSTAARDPSATDVTSTLVMRSGASGASSTRVELLICRPNSQSDFTFHDPRCVRYPLHQLWANVVLQAL
jgi:hypothetical protein